MDFEAPVDAWYVWLGAGIASVAMAGVVLSLPATAPPDATAAANAIDRAAGSTANATATYDHDADAFRIDGKGIELRNEGGTSYESVAFGTLTLARLGGVRTDDGDVALRAVLYGDDIAAHYESREAFLDDVALARQRVDDAPRKWRSARGTLRVRSITVGETRVTLVGL